MELSLEFIALVLSISALFISFVTKQKIYNTISIMGFLYLTISQGHHDIVLAGAFASATLISAYDMFWVRGE